MHVAMTDTSERLELAFEGDRLSLDPADPRFFGSPYAAYARMHAERASFVWTELGHRCFAAHEDVSALLRDRRFGRAPSAEALRERMPAFAAVERHSLLETEPPEHTALRKLANRAFVSRAIAELRPTIERTAHEALDAMIASGEPCDLLPAYATPIPVETIARLLGVPVGDGERLVDWSHAMVAIYQPGRTAEVEARAESAAVAFGDYVRAAIEGRRREPRDDLLTRMVAATEDERAFSDDQIVSLAILLLNAGHEATVHQIGNAVVSILNAEANGLPRAAWIGRPDAIVDEVMRHDPPLHLFTRVAHEDVAWTDADGERVPILAGETIGLLLGAANHDPRRYAEPSRFDPTRDARDHVALGGGIHYCLGAPLARMEIAIALGVLFERLPKLAVVGAPRRADTWHFNGYESLPVRW